MRAGGLTEARRARYARPPTAGLWSVTPGNAWLAPVVDDDEPSSDGAQEAYSACSEPWVDDDAVHSVCSSPGSVRSSRSRSRHNARPRSRATSPAQSLALGGACTCATIEYPHPEFYCPKGQRGMWTEVEQVSAALAHVGLPAPHALTPQGSGAGARFVYRGAKCVVNLYSSSRTLLVQGDNAGRWDDRLRAACSCAQFSALNRAHNASAVGASA